MSVQKIICISLRKYPPDSRLIFLNGETIFSYKPVKSILYLLLKAYLKQ